jgi:hypothetical protein
MWIYDKLFPIDPYTEEEYNIRQFFIVPKYLHWRNRRREKLLRKWGKTSYFTKQSVSGTWEVSFMSLVPEDDKWHHIAATATAYVKKDKVGKKSKSSQYLDGVKIATVTLTNKEKLR